MIESRSTVEDHLAHLADRLVADFRDHVPEHVIRGVVAEEVERHRAARIRQFLPVLVDRAARQRLQSPSPAWRTALTAPTVIDVTEVSA